jgi:valyl-tRNA synthetase
MVKPRLYSENKDEKIAVCFVLDYVFGVSLKLLHPFMPFLTSEIYSKLVHYNDIALMMSKWPNSKEKFEFEKEEQTVEKIKKLITEIRNVRTKMNVHPSKKSKLILVTDSLAKELDESKEFLSKLGFASEIKIQSDLTGIDEKAISIVVDDLKAFIPFEELVDIGEEIARLEAEKKRLESEVQRGEKMLSNPGFVNKAPEAKVNEEKAKLENYKEMLKTVEERLASLK